MKTTTLVDIGGGVQSLSHVRLFVAPGAPNILRLEFDKMVQATVLSLDKACGAATTTEWFYMQEGCWSE